MSGQRERKVELVARLLAKAESTTPEEAEALTAAAEKIMLQWQIERAELEAATGDPATVTEREYFIGPKQYARARCSSLESAIGGLGQCATFYRENRITGNITFVIAGVTADADDALRLAESIDRQQMHAMRVWWKGRRDYFAGWATEHEKLQERRGFIIGFGVGVQQRLARAREAMLADTSSSTALVLVGHLEKVQDHMAAKEIKIVDRAVPGSGTAFIEGSEKGREAITDADREVAA